jgi:hypothetical protein
MQEARNLVHRALVALDEGDREQAGALLADAIAAIDGAKAEKPRTLLRRLDEQPAPTSAPAPQPEQGEQPGKKQGMTLMQLALVFIVILTGLGCGMCGYQFLFVG